MANIIAHSYDWGLYFIQQQNVHHKTGHKKLENIKKESNEISEQSTDMKTSVTVTEEKEEEMIPPSTHGMILLSKQETDVTVPPSHPAPTRATNHSENYSAL